MRTLLAGDCYFSFRNLFALIVIIISLLVKYSPSSQFYGGGAAEGATEAGFGAELLTEASARKTAAAWR
jgi:hypothetical protein